jgi:predicted RNase H-like nuclease (RuvC/YqgF family)
MNKPLYEKDFFAWTQAQADALRRRSANELDWENLFEEVESMGRQQRRELTRRLAILLGHILKWENQSDQRSRSWANTIRHQQREITDLLEENPSLNAALPQAWQKALELGRDLAAYETGLVSEDIKLDASITFDSAMEFQTDI